MREYGKVAILFWQRGSGRRLRGDTEAQVVALYLVSCAYSNSVGLFYLGLPVLAHDVGIPLEGASEALRRVCAAGFAKYDEVSELVWVPNLAEIEIGNSLKSGDKRKGFIAGLAASFRNHPFAKEFHDLYGERFGLETPKALGSPFEGVVKLLWDPSEANSKAIQVQSQKQERNYTEIAKRKTPSAPAAAPAGYSQVVACWFEHYEKRYSQKSKWGKRSGNQLKQLLDEYTPDELCELIPYFFAWKRAEVINAGHSFGKGYACFVSKLDELRADIVDPERRQEAGVAKAHERRTEKTSAVDDAVETAIKILEGGASVTS